MENVVNAMDGINNTERQIILRATEQTVPMLHRQLNIYDRREKMVKGVAKGTIQGSKIIGKASVELIKLGYQAIVKVLGGVKEATKYLIDHGTQVLHLVCATAIVGIVYMTYRTAMFVTQVVTEFVTGIQTRLSGLGKQEAENLIKEADSTSLTLYVDPVQKIETIGQELVELITSEGRLALKEAIQEMAGTVILTASTALILAGVVVTAKILKDMHDREMQQERQREPDVPLLTETILTERDREREEMRAMMARREELRLNHERLMAQLGDDDE
jgi:hypothetical protein